MAASLESQVASTVTLVPIKEIKSAPWNPPNRVEERRLRKLQESIEDIGQIYPIVLDEKRNVVDGHRRLAIAKKKGQKHIPAITVSSEFQHAYGSIQLNQMKLSGNDLLCVYLSNPNALLANQRSNIANIEEQCGRGMVEMLYKAGLTGHVFGTAMKVVRYLEAKIDVKDALRWIVKHSMGRTIEALIEGGIPSESILKAIKNNRPIKVGLKEIEE